MKLFRKWIIITIDKYNEIKNNIRATLYLELKEQYEELQKSYSELQTEYGNFKATYKDTKLENIKLHSENAKIQRQYDEKKEELSSLQTRYNDLWKTYDRLTDRDAKGRFVKNE